MKLRQTLVGPVLVAAVALGASLPASADINGFLNGRPSDPGGLPPLSIEVGIQDLGFARSIGARINFPVGGNITGFANLATIDYDFSDVDGFSVGGGAFIHLPNQRISDAIDIAMKPTLNYFTVEGTFFERDIITAGFEFAVSGKEPIASTSLNWFANAGIAVLINDGTGNDDTDFEPIIGGGLYMPLGPGQFYFGAELFDGDFDPGVGYRFFL